ncbi:Asparagine synthetase [Tumidithrix helvetica PCC 7403]|uniref:asparagine synthase (glutamine-hydrolyzing) n=1 Tax=Tumidithrix helvetica TaxID=3457545 RepID=UPI003C9EC01F
MCGISGIWRYDLKPIDRSLLATFTEMVSHRGPDHSGFYFADAVGLGLGHRRLSILDLSAAGHQPMASVDGHCWLVYNGEIYNYLELAAELTELGYIFRSHSDTEVLLAAYQAWGYDCLHRFNGMFAFLLWDEKKQVLWAARDRFGIKPLYIYEQPQLIAFASEIKQFTTLPNWSAKLNPQRTYDFLAYGLLDHTKETMFQGVYQLRGGEYLTLHCDRARPNFGKLQVQQWYELPSVTQEMTMVDAQSKLQFLLQDSVNLRLRADVTVGSCLSGGLDSSAIVCLSDRLRQATSPYPFQTFSSCFEDERYDERQYIQSVVERTQIEPHFLFPSGQELFEQLDRLTWVQDEPFASTSIFAQWCVFRQASQSGVKVILDGQGADEILAGYTRFYAALFAGFLHDGQWGQLFHEVITCKRYQSPLELQGIIEPLLPEWIRQPLRQMLGYASDKSVPNWLNAGYLDQLGIDPQASAQIAIAPLRSIRDLSRQQLTSISLPALLHWEDRNSMAHSIESRVPFLDYRLVEFIYTLDDSLKIQQGQSKAILREAMRGIVPESIRTRQDKMGFVTPAIQWMRHDQREQFALELQKAIANLGEWLHPNILQQLFTNAIDGKEGLHTMIWRTISFSRWLQVFQVER